MSFLEKGYDFSKNRKLTLTFLTPRADKCNYSGSIYAIICVL